MPWSSPSATKIDAPREGLGRGRRGRAGNGMPKVRSWPEAGLGKRVKSPEFSINEVYGNSSFPHTMVGLSLDLPFTGSIK